MAAAAVTPVIRIVQGAKCSPFVQAPSKFRAAQNHPRRDTEDRHEQCLLEIVGRRIFQTGGFGRLADGKAKRQHRFRQSAQALLGEATSVALSSNKLTQATEVASPSAALHTG